MQTTLTSGSEQERYSSWEIALQVDKSKRTGLARTSSISSTSNLSLLVGVCVFSSSSPRATLL